MNYEIKGQGYKGDGYFTVHWSPFAKADKYEIARAAPAMSGIAELYYMDEAGKINLFCLQRSWYGGIRSMVRMRSDIELENDEYRRGILEKYKDKIYYRYTCSNSVKDLDDVMFFFMSTYSPEYRGPDDSGRYARIYVKEIDAQKITTA